MAWAHGKETQITIDGDNIIDANTSEFSQESDEHDMTVYGDDDENAQGGILRGSFTMGGKYLVGATGTAAILEPLLGTVVTFVGKPEGTGTGKPNYAMNVLVKKFVTTHPVADYITWSAELKKSGALTITAQA